MSLGGEAAARGISRHAGSRGLCHRHFINSPVDLAGRLRMTTFGPYVSNLGYDPNPRAADIDAIYCDGPEVAKDRMARYGATYVLSSGGILDCDVPTISCRARCSRRSTPQMASASGGCGDRGPGTR